MRKKVLFLAAATIFVMATSFAVFGDDDIGDLNTVITDLPPGSPCICPMIFDPVVCTVQNPDGSTSRQAFSNICVATCNGATNCVKVVIRP